MQTSMVHPDSSRKLHIINTTCNSLKSILFEKKKLTELTLTIRFCRNLDAPCGHGISKHSTSRAFSQKRAKNMESRRDALSVNWFKNKDEQGFIVT